MESLSYLVNLMYTIYRGEGKTNIVIISLYVNYKELNA